MASSAFVRIDDRWSRDGLPVVTLENRHSRVVICPTPGAPVLTVEHRASGTDLLLQNPRIEHRAVPIGTIDDDTFAGGWQECEVRAMAFVRTEPLLGFADDGQPIR